MSDSDATARKGALKGIGGWRMEGEKGERQEGKEGREGSRLTLESMGGRESEEVV